MRYLSLVIASAIMAITMLSCGPKQTDVPTKTDGTEQTSAPLGRGVLDMGTFELTVPTDWDTTMSLFEGMPLICEKEGMLVSVSLAESNLPLKSFAAERLMSMQTDINGFKLLRTNDSIPGVIEYFYEGLDDDAPFHQVLRIQTSNEGSDENVGLYYGLNGDYTDADSVMVMDIVRSLKIK